MNILPYYLGYGMGAQIGITLVYSVLSLLYFFPFLQALVVYQREKWLLNTLSGMDKKAISEEAKNKVLNAAKPAQSVPLYKIFKFYLVATGAILVLTGLLTMILQDPDPDVLKLLIFLPAIYGGAFYLLYTKLFMGNGLWRELTATFMFVGFAITFFGFFPVYGFDWMRSDIAIYIVLAVGLFITHWLKSTIASYVYMLAVTIGAALLTSNVGYNWLYFLKSGIWFFALGSLVFWMPRLKEAKSIEAREITFGILFMIMMITVTFTNLGRLGYLGLVVMLPILYMFSKIYFKQEGWFITKPIQTILSVVVLVAAVAFSFEEAFGIIPSFKAQFGDFGFYILVDYLVIIAMIFGAVMMFRDNFEDDLNKVNIYVLGFPVLLFLCGFLGEYGGQYIMLGFLFAFGYDALNKGLERKDEIILMFGTTTLIYGLGSLIAKLSPELLMERFMIGFIQIVFAGALLGIAFYLRKNWTVTDEDGEGPAAAIADRSDLLDTTPPVINNDSNSEEE